MYKIPLIVSSTTWYTMKLTDSAIQNKSFNINVRIVKANFIGKLSHNELRLTTLGQNQIALTYRKCSHFDSTFAVPTSVIDNN